MPCGCCWKSQRLLANFFEWRRFFQWKLSRFNWNFEMKPWKNSCFSGKDLNLEALTKLNWRSGLKKLLGRKKC